MTYTVNLPQQPGFRYDVRQDDIACYFGNSTDKTIPAVNFGPYQAPVQNNGQPVTTYSIPQHDRFARWLHEITPDKVFRTPQECFNLCLIFPYGNPGKKQPPTPGTNYTGPMSTAGLRTSMGDVAERPDIGLLDEWEAYWLRTADPVPMLTIARGFDSMPIWIIDERTGRFWDLHSHPMATLFWQASSQPDFIASAPQANADRSLYPPGTVFGQWTLDMAHGPAIYCSYLATGLLRHLERLQAFTNWAFLETNYYVGIMGFPICSLAQMRKFAWHLRLLFMAYAATLDYETRVGPVPAPGLPSTYWKKHLDNQRALITQKYIADPALQTFRYFPDVTSYRPWQFDYLLPTVLFGTLIPTLTQEWGPVAEWCMDNPIQRLNGKSGHPPAYIGAYEMLLGPNMPPNGDPNNFPFTYKPTDFDPDWGTPFQRQAAAVIAAGGGVNMTPAQMQALLATPDGNGHIISWDPFPTKTLRHLMAAADHIDINGIWPFRQKFADFDLCLKRVTDYALDWESQAAGNVIESRVSIVSSLLAAPPPVQPPSTNPPPPPPQPLPATPAGNLQRAKNILAIVKPAP